MGCGSSVVTASDGDPDNDIAKLQLSSSELSAFRKAFQKIDTNKSGSINIGEFIESLHVERTIVSEEVFEDMDTSNDGHISFKEFTMLTWRFCTRGLDSIAEFAFDIYDTDNSQELTKDEIKEMIIEAYGKVTEKHNVNIFLPVAVDVDVHLMVYVMQVNSVIHAFDKDGDLIISRKEFTKTVKRMPNILQPATFFQVKSVHGIRLFCYNLCLQSTLRNHIGDKEFWTKLCDKAERYLVQHTKAPMKCHCIRMCFLWWA